MLRRLLMTLLAGWLLKKLLGRAKRPVAAPSVRTAARRW